MIHIYSDNKRSMLIRLHSSFKRKAKNLNKLVIHYGLKKVTVTPLFSNSVSENKCYLSFDAINYLGLPINLPYEVKFKENNLIIGPYIGILSAVTNENLHQSIPSLSTYVKHYEEIGGTIIAFSLEGVNIEKQVISGLIYDPNNKTWIEGTFCYPSSIFSVVETSLTENWSVYVKTMDHFHINLGKRVFNYPNFDKWHMYQLLKRTFEQYLPKTMIYSEPEDVRKMIQEFPSLYIKPVNGRLGKYVLKLTKIQSGVIMRYGRLSNREKHFTSWGKLRQYLNLLLKKDSYLIQQAIDLITSDNQIIDFRIMLVKNSHEKWENVGAFARYGIKNSIVSNITAGGKAGNGALTLKTVLNLTKGETINLINQINQLIKDAITELEEHGFHLGNLGFDIGIDKNKKIWIIEINNQNPDHYIAVKANKRNILYQAKLYNILYAKALSLNYY